MQTSQIWAGRAASRVVRAIEFANRRRSPPFSSGAGPASPSSSPSPSSPLSAWWANLRAGLAEALAPLPEPPGYTNTSLLDPERWAAAPPGAVRHAARVTARELWGDYRRLFASLAARAAPPPPPTPTPTTTTDAPSGDNSPATERGSVADAVRATAIAAATLAARQAGGTAGVGPARLAGAGAGAPASADEELRNRATAAAADALALARDCVDEFLAGYEEGKMLDLERARAEAAADAAAPAATTPAAPAPAPSAALPASAQAASHVAPASEKAAPTHASASSPASAHAVASSTSQNSTQ